MWSDRTSPQQAELVMPQADLPPLPPSLWASWDIEQAVAHGSPGAVIAIARRAHGLRQDELGPIAGFSQSAISRLESGGNLAYDTRILRIFQRLLGIPARLLGLADERIAVPPNPRQADGVMVTVDSRTLLKALSSNAFDAHAKDTWKSLSKVAYETSPVDPDVVRRLLVVRRVVNDSDNWIGSTELRPAVADLYDFVESLRAGVRGELRRELLEVAGLYAEFQGWMHQQAGEQHSAVRWTERALHQAQAAESTELVAYSYIRMSQLADDHTDNVLSLARAARRERRISKKLRAMAANQEAWGQALAGDENSCLSLLDEATRQLDGVEPSLSAQYQVGSWFDQQHVDMRRAACCVELGRAREAILLYEQGILDWPSVCRWELGVHLAKLARAYATVGELDQACKVAAEALTVSRDCAPTMIVGELRKLAPWQDVPAVGEILNSA